MNLLKTVAYATIVGTIVATISVLISFYTVWKKPDVPAVIVIERNKSESKDMRSTEEPSKKIEPPAVRPSKETKASQPEATSILNKEAPQSKPPVKTEISKKQKLALKKLTEVPAANTRLDEFKSLINKISPHPSLTNIALVIDSKKIKSSFSPQAKLYNLFRTDKVNIIENLFQKKPFINKGFFREIYEGNIEILKQSEALRGIDYLLLGKINFSFKKQGLVDSDLISCDINFSYKIIGQNGNVVNSDNIRITGSGFSEDGAFERGLEMLAEQYSDKIFKKI